MVQQWKEIFGFAEGQTMRGRKGLASGVQFGHTVGSQKAPARPIAQQEVGKT